MLRHGLCSAVGATAAVGSLSLTRGPSSALGASFPSTPLASSDSSLTTCRRDRSSVAAFFGFPAFRGRYKPKGEEETRQEQEKEARAQAETQRRYHTLGDYLDRMPPSLRMLLIWSPILLLFYFCCKQQRDYYMAEGEWFYCLLLPASVRARLRGDDGGSALRTRLVVPKRATKDTRREHPKQGEDSEDPPQLAGTNGTEEASILNSAAPEERRGALARPFSASLDFVAETKKQPDGHIITRLKQMTYMEGDDVKDAQKEAGIAKQREAAVKAAIETHQQRSLFSPRRWTESLSQTIQNLRTRQAGDSDSGVASGEEKSGETGPIVRSQSGSKRRERLEEGSGAAAVFSPPVKPFSTERVTVIVGHPRDESQGLLGYLWSWAPTHLLTRMTGFRGSTKKEYDDLLQRELTTYYANVKEMRVHDNIWNKPVFILRDEVTGKVVGYSINP